MRLWLCLPPILFVACGDAAPPERSRRSNARETEMASQDQGGVDVVDTAPPRSSNQGGSKAADAGQRQRTGTSTARAAGGSGGMSMAASSQRKRDAGVSDAGRAKAAEADADSPSSPDAASNTQSAPDAASEPMQPAQNTGSCCSTSNQPGCGDLALRACVCERESRCCTDAWDEVCTRIVKEKHCQGSVRDCVCGVGAGQWQQAYCCQGGWNDTCESVAHNKCGATADCP